MLDSTQIKRFIEIWETSPNRHQAQKRMLADDTLKSDIDRPDLVSTPRRRMMSFYFAIRDTYDVALTNLPMGESDRMRDRRANEEANRAYFGERMNRYAAAIRELAAAEAAISAP